MHTDREDSVSQPGARRSPISGVALGVIGAISALLIAAPAGGLHAMSAPAVAVGATDSAPVTEAAGTPDVVAITGVEAATPEVPSAETAGLAVLPSPAAAPPVTKTVSMVDNRNLPLRLAVAAGTTVRWINDGAVPHTVSTQDGAIESGFLTPGQSYAFTFDTPGEYVYFCRPHAFLGMTGVVVVQ